MIQSLQVYQILLSLILVLAKKDDIDLPICPQNVQFLPQELPMHCRLPRSTDAQAGPFPIFQNAEKQPFQFPPLPFPGLPGMIPGMPPGMSPRMPLNLPQGLQPNFPQGLPPGMQQGSPDPSTGMSKAMPMPMPMPIAMPGNSPHKMPVIVMPFYSQDRKPFKKPPHHSKHSSKRPHKKRPHYHGTSEIDSDEDSDDTSDSKESREGWWKPPRKGKGSKKYGIYRRSNTRHHNMKKKKKEVLTPILQYVTKDGYVIFEKRITKNEANNWLEPKDQAKAKDEINFKRRLEKQIQDDVVEQEEEEFIPDEIKKPKEKKEKSNEVKEVNEVDETEEPTTENHPKRHKLKKYGSLLDDGP
ncbi:unnamed protein product [Arctia plantaginis]|uniref:Uncharacterized protein n=1 Tax=Arctia plantaginis TaxID=874455 RepID=A0A8S0ZPL4_ARCPL|nr:unnamed protein product [Arctia plantaginis]